MRKRIIITGIAVLMLFGARILSGQDTLSHNDRIIAEMIPPNFMAEDFMSTLPRLSSLIDSAEEQSPLLAHNATELKVYEREVKAEKRRIMENLSLESSFKYGMFDNFYIAENPIEAMTDSYLSTSEQFRYSAGITLRLPLFNFYDRKNQIKIAKLKLEMGKEKLEETRQQIRQMVIANYNELLSLHRILLLRNQEVISSEIQVLMGENQFRNGEITIEQLTRYKSTFIKAQIDLETAQKDLITTYLILQEITGVKF